MPIRTIFTPAGPNPRDQALGGGTRGPSTRVPLPDRTLPIYTHDPTLKEWDKSGRDVASPLYYSPFAGGVNTGSRGKGSGEHEHEYIGGTADLLPTVATRGIAINQLAQLLDRTGSGADAAQTQNTMSNYARQQDNPYLSSMVSNMLPSVDRDYRLEDVQNRQALTDLLGQAYVLGGNILGSSWANTAYVNNYNNMIEQQQKDKIGAIFGGIPYVGGIIQGGVAFS